MTKVTILYNVTKKLPGGTKEDLLTTDLTADAKAINKYLKREGFACQLFEVTENNYQQLRHFKTDVCFNLCYGIGSLPNSEHKIPQILEKAKIAYTGANAKAILLTTNKAKTKRLLLKNNIPTPKWQIIHNNNFQLSKNFKFPLMVKPLSEDSSCGIKQDSVATNTEELKKQIKKLLAVYKQPVLAEEYIEGRELRVSILGNSGTARVLPITEISFKGAYKKKWKIVDFNAKWDDKFDKDTPAKQAKLDKTIYRKIEKLALKVYRLCGCSGYADIDIRLRKETPYFIEVNCNPGIAPTDGTERLAKAAGITYGQYLKAIVMLALSKNN
ncbi:MAG: ATP-grasp domain-containing protein [Patescibacteria group bacterium]|nr:ATP-grasp domain-containing protein [Patescibacteria group bacterium]